MSVWAQNSIVDLEYSLNLYPQNTEIAMKTTKQFHKLQELLAWTAWNWEKKLVIEKKREKEKTCYHGGTDEQTNSNGWLDQAMYVLIEIKNQA